MNILHQLNLCRERAAVFLDSQLYVTETECYWLHSPNHDPASRPSHLLYGTWAGTFASVLIGLDARFDSSKRLRIGRALNRFQVSSSGAFAMPDVSPADRQGHNDEYLIFHCTNYALGALRALDQSARHPLLFMESFSTQQQLSDWLSRRDWARPWTEGNNIVNLASFYAVLAEDGQQWAHERLLEIADWHDANQNPRTGFWHSYPGNDLRSLLYATAGAAHNLHVYYYLDRNIPQPERIVDSCLRQGYMGIRSACIDIDVVDILVNFRHYNYRRDKIDNILKRYLVELLQVQNRDGGFCDNYVTPETLYGLTTPAGISLTWATWFRLATIGMIACALFPEERTRWTFRNTIGSCYCNLDYALREAADFERNDSRWHVPSTARLWLSTRRESRFVRQRLTWSARQRLGQ